MSDSKLKGYLYFAIEKVTDLPKFGENSDRVDSYVSVFVDDMEEGSTNTVYDEENPEFNKQLRVKLNGYYDTCDVQVLNAQPRAGWSDNLGQVVLDLKKLTANTDQQTHASPLTLRQASATGDAKKDNVQGKLHFVTKWKPYKKRQSKAEREAALAKARADAEKKRQEKLEAERKELEARLEFERKQEEEAEKKRLAAAKALQEKQARERAEAQAAAAAARAKEERERREAAAKAALEAKAREEAKRQEELRIAQEKQRAENEKRQLMLLEAQKKSQDAAARAEAEKQIQDIEEGNMMEVDEMEADDILSPPRGPLTTQSVSKQLCPTTRLSGTVSNVSAGLNGDLYVANSTDRIFRLIKATNKWKQIPGRAICLAAAPDGTVWCANRFQRIYELQADGRTWRQIPGSYQWLGIGSKEHIWAVDIRGIPFQFDPSTKRWTQKPGHNFQRVAVGDDGEVWAVTKEQRAYRWEGKGWRSVPGNIKDISVQNKSCVWATSVVGGLYRWKGNSWEKIQGSDNYHGCTVSDKGAWAFDANGRLYHCAAPVAPKLSFTVCLSQLGNVAPQYALDKALDNDSNSFYWSGAPQTPGLMIMMMFKEPLLREQVNVVSGKPAGVGGAAGKIVQGRCEVTFDGRSWIALGPTQDGQFQSSLPSLAIRGFRIVFLRPGPQVVLQKIEFTGLPSRPALTGCAVKKSIGHYGDYDVFRALDNDIGSFYWTGAPPKKGDYIEVKFKQPVQKDKVIVISGMPQDAGHFITAASLSMCYDGHSFTDAQNFANSITYELPEGKVIHGLRLEFLQEGVDWVAIREISLV